jgi:transposase
MVFLDESSARTDMTRSYGWSPSCQRCHFSVPNGYWKNVTMLSAIRQSGLIKEATLAIEGAMTRDVFEGYIESMLGPSLRAGDVVIMDNLPAHKGGQVESLIESFGASVWYLPPYSPDLNPIELTWNTAKSWLKQIAARSIKDLYEAIGTALERIKPVFCKRYFEHCGYAG